MNRLQNTLKYFRIKKETCWSRRIAATWEGQGPFTTKKRGEKVLSLVLTLACPGQVKKLLGIAVIFLNP